MADLLTELTRTLGPDIVLAGTEVPERNRDDWSGLPPTRPSARASPPHHRAGRGCLARVPSLPSARRAPGRSDRPVRRGARLEGEIALSLERMVGIEEIDPATATMTVLAGTPLERVQEAADAGWLPRGPRSRCARLLRHRRQHRHQRGRQPGDPLRHDPRDGAGPRGGAGRRHRAAEPQQADQEQCRLRPEAALHRQRGHARRGHPRRAPPPPQARQRPGRVLRARRLHRRGRAPQERPRRAGSHALRFRGDAE